MATAAVVTDITPACPYCRQPLVNRAAMLALRRSEVAIATQIAEGAAAHANEIAAAKIAEVREQLAAQADEWREKYDALKRQAKDANVRLREQLEKDLESKAERKVNGQVRSLRQTLEKTVAEKDLLARKLEHINAAERGAFHEDDVVRDLKAAFPDDHVNKRGKGGDILHEVFYRRGGERTRAGLIVYECKDTIHWANSFIDEVKGAAEQHRTPHAVIVTRAFPPRQKDLLVRDGVVIVHPDRAVELIRVLRSGVCAIYRASLTAEGQAEKTLVLYRYLMSENFRQRFEALIEIERRLKGNLNDERKAHQRTWERREAWHNDLGEHLATIDEGLRNVLEQRDHANNGKVIRLSPP